MMLMLEPLKLLQMILVAKVLVLSTMEISSDETYISKMTQNLENLKEALC